MYVCSYHFIDVDFKLPNKDAAPEFRKAILKPDSIPAWNLRGDEMDERIPYRNSRTSIKARTSTGNAQWNNIKEMQTTETQTSEKTIVSCDKTINLRQASNSEFNLADNHIKNGSFNHLSIQSEEATAAGSNHCLIQAQEETKSLQKQLFRFENLSVDQIKSYTTLEPTVFKIVCEMIKHFFPLKYWTGKTVTSITVEDELLIFIMKLRLDLPYFDLVTRYSVSITTIQNIFLTYLHACHEIFFVGCMCKTLHRKSTRLVCQIHLVILQTVV